jgi:hypothetical protein
MSKFVMICGWERVVMHNILSLSNILSFDLAISIHSVSLEVTIIWTFLLRVSGGSEQLNSFKKSLKIPKR